jgi:hypothetical protein
MKTLLGVAILLAASPACAETLTFPKNELYANARATLLQQGWKPVHAPERGFVCHKGDARCEGRAETVVCAGTGLANCLFRWQRDKTIIEIETIGEDHPTVKYLECKAGCP